MFNIFTGNVTSLYIAIPGSIIDKTSGLNGWLDCSDIWGGSGTPGSVTGQGGNGDDGCRRQGSASQQGAFAINTDLTNAYCNIDMGTAGTAQNGYTILVRFGLANGKTVSALSLEDWNPS